MLQNIETNEGETLWWNQKNFKKSNCAEKNPRENTKRGILCFRGSVRRWVCFGRGSGGVSSMFWRSVVDDVEQMNKKWTDRVELTIKKTRHCKSRAFCSKMPAKKHGKQFNKTENYNEKVAQKLLYILSNKLCCLLLDICSMFQIFQDTIRE